MYLRFGFAHPAHLRSTCLAAPAATLNGQQLSFDVSPVIENGQPLIPFRVIFESLGANVLWDEQTQTVTATKEGRNDKIDCI